ncbi:MAG: dipeptidase [Pirellulales bacterium]|nr:dipeptidase [Pirellulales bacterium]
MLAIQTDLSQHAPRAEADLCELLRIPSVSAISAHAPDIQRAADWLHGYFRDLGYQSAIHATPGHPIVLARTPAVDGAITVLVYGHYDVQPPDPLGQWISPPFEPTVRQGNLFARGATDDKGQFLTHVQSAASWTRTAGAPPVNLIFLIEGEEEIGSPNLVPFLQRHASELACDVAVISDTSQFAPDLPAITYGLRGIAYYELTLTGPRQDLHSGTFGGGVTNPANVLVKILGNLHDSHGRVAIPGFYDAVVPLTDRERQEYAQLPFTDQAFFEQVGVSGAFGEAGYTTLERRWARPTCDINGLTSGYQGEGAKTVLPARASAKFSFRLVPRQDPHALSASLREWIAEQIPAGITWELTDFHGAPGVLVSLDSPYVACAQRAIEQGFGRAPVFIREGGSIPIVGDFKEILGVDTLLLGWGQNDDNMHSPNEKFSLADYHRGIRASAALWEEFAKLPRPAGKGNV